MSIVSPRAPGDRAAGATGVLAAYHVLAALLLLALTLRTAVTGLSPLLPRVVPASRSRPVEAGLVGALPPFSLRRCRLDRAAAAAARGRRALVVLACSLRVAGLVSRALVGGPWPFIAFSVVALLGMGLGNVVLPVLVKAWFPHRIATGHVDVRHGRHRRDVAAGAVRGARRGRRRAGRAGRHALGWQVGCPRGPCLSVLVAARLAGARRCIPAPSPRPDLGRER